MPRKPRSKSPTGYFHVTLRGNGGQLLFDDAEDRIAMLQILDAILPKHNIELIAWCLMGNHINLARQSCRVSQDALRRNSNPSPSHFEMRRFSRFENKG